MWFATRNSPFSTEGLEDLRIAYSLAARIAQQYNEQPTVCKVRPLVFWNKQRQRWWWRFRQEHERVRRTETTRDISQYGARI